MKPACETDEYASMPLDALLRERGEVADDERRDGEHGDRDRPDLRLLGERGHEHAEHDDERRRLRRRRHERRHRGRRALVDVRRPHVERRRRRLEGEPGEDHRHAGDEERVVGAGAPRGSR